MRIEGLQKLTLLDYPGLVACTVFTAGCNFRCPFCHNASLVLPERLTGQNEEEAVLSFLKKRQGILDGVAVSGGEPLLQPDLEEFLQRVKEMGYKVKLDTNGTFPDRLISLVRRGLVDKVAMDIKNSPALYEKTAGAAVDFDALARSKDFLLEGNVDYEFRTTVVKGLHTRQSIGQAAQWIQGAKEYYLQQFQDSGDILQREGLGDFDEAQMKEFAAEAARFVPAVKLRGL